MTQAAVQYFNSRDGLRLAYREFGTGRPLILIHGYTQNAVTMASTGITEKIVSQGYRVIMPDLRGHGDSEIGRAHV